MMKITVNGREIDFTGATVQDIITRFDLDIDVLVVERNGVIVHREDVATTMVHDGDEFELVRFVGGG